MRKIICKITSSSEATLVCMYRGNFFDRLINDVINLTKHATRIYYIQHYTICEHQCAHAHAHAHY